jgi:hypothetical protein
VNSCKTVRLSEVTHETTDIPWRVPQSASEACNLNAYIHYKYL